MPKEFVCNETIDGTKVVLHFLFPLSLFLLPFVVQQITIPLLLFEES